MRYFTVDTTKTASVDKVVDCLRQFIEHEYAGVARDYVLKLAANIAEHNKKGQLNPAGFYLSMIQNLEGLSRAEADHALAVIPVLIEYSEHNLGSDFAQEVKKFREILSGAIHKID